MQTNRPFTAQTNKLAYAQAFSRASNRHVERGPRGVRRRSLFALRTRRG